MPNGRNEKEEQESNLLSSVWTAPAFTRMNPVADKQEEGNMDSETGRAEEPEE